MYTRQHDLAANLFLAPGEEAKAEETAAAPAAEPGSPLSGIDLLSET
jgi:hypothetical protein